jgi:hypothetical protein
MNVIVGFEYSGTVANAFALRGHNVVSNDLLDNESFGNHHKGDIFSVPGIMEPGTFDMGIFFPSCQFNANAQAHMLIADPERMEKHKQSVELIKKVWKLPIPRIAIENPKGMLSTSWMLPHQVTSFHEFGDPYLKDICLWLKNLPCLVPTNIVKPTKSLKNKVNGRMTQQQRSHIKSRFQYGIADAMAEQWGGLKVF